MELVRMWLQLAVKSLPAALRISPARGVHQLITREAVGTIRGHSEVPIWDPRPIPRAAGNDFRRELQPRLPRSRRPAAQYRSLSSVASW